LYVLPHHADGLVAALTNSRIMGSAVQSQRQAWETYGKLASDPRVLFTVEPPTLEDHFRSLTQDSSPSHSRWTDAYLAAFALACPCELVTLEKDFRAPAELKLVLLASSE
jgi:predicted nucleic acid-binding protein